MKKARPKSKKRLALRQKTPPTRPAKDAMSIDRLLAKASKARRKSAKDIDLTSLSREQIIEILRKTAIRPE
jgi:hypothetical protein